MLTQEQILSWIEPGKIYVTFETAAGLAIGQLIELNSKTAQIKTKSGRFLKIHLAKKNARIHPSGTVRL